MSGSKIEVAAVPLILALASACTLLNAPGTLTHETDCDDGIDNDGDGKTDCADDECVTQFSCFTKIHLARDESCPVRAPAIALDDDLRYLDASVWRQDHEPLDLNADGVLFNTINHVLSLSEPLRVGGGVPLEIDFDLHAPPTIGLESDDIALEILGRADLIARVKVHSSTSPNGAFIACELGFPGGSSSDAKAVDVRTETQIEVTVGDAQGDLVVKADGAEVCRLGTLGMNELAARLRFVGLTVPFHDGMRLRHVRLALGEEIPSERCAAARRPLLGECAPIDAVPGLGGVVAHAPDGYHVFSLIGHARSPTGLGQWSIDSVPDMITYRAVIFDQEQASFLAWGQRPFDSSTLEAGVMMLAPLEKPTMWRVIDKVTLDGKPWVPVAVVAGPSGYFALDWRPDAIFGATSADGIQWTSIGPLFGVGDGHSGAWENNQIAPLMSIAWTGHYYLIAYAAGDSAGDTRVGVIASSDGVSWVRHPDNPILSGEDIGFDDVAVVDPDMLVEDQRLRIWYLGRGSSSDGSQLSRSRMCESFTHAFFMEAEVLLEPEE